MEVEHLTQVIQLVRAELGFRQQPTWAKTRDVHSTASSKWLFICGVGESWLNQASRSCLLFQVPTWGHCFYSFLQIMEELGINILCALKRCWLGTRPPTPPSLPPCARGTGAKPLGGRRSAAGVQGRDLTEQMKTSRAKGAREEGTQAEPFLRTYSVPAPVWGLCVSSVSVPAAVWRDSVRTVHRSLPQLSAGERGVKGHSHHTRLPPIVATVSDLTHPANPLRGGGGIAGDLLIILTIVSVALRSSPPHNMNLSSRQFYKESSRKMGASAIFPLHCPEMHSVNFNLKEATQNMIQFSSFWAGEHIQTARSSRRKNGCFRKIFFVRLFRI